MEPWEAVHPRGPKEPARLTEREERPLPTVKGGLGGRASLPTCPVSQPAARPPPIHPVGTGASRHGSPEQVCWGPARPIPLRRRFRASQPRSKTTAARRPALRTPAPGAEFRHQRRLWSRTDAGLLGGRVPPNVPDGDLPVTATVARGRSLPWGVNDFGSTRVKVRM